MPPSSKQSPLPRGGLLVTPPALPCFSSPETARCAGPISGYLPIHPRKKCRPFGRHFCKSDKNQRLENCGARRAALRPHFLRAQPGKLPGWGPGILKCSAEVNSACAKVLPTAKRLYGAFAPPHPGDGALKERKKTAARMGGSFVSLTIISAWRTEVRGERPSNRTSCAPSCADRG